MHFSDFALGIANGRLLRKLWSLGSKGVMLDSYNGYQGDDVAYGLCT